MTTPKAAKMPSLIYGTAWKKDHTRALVHQALKAGFRGIDTAGQPKHYREDLVGQGIRDAINEGVVRREDLYIQSKFTSIQGQDPKKMPYNPKDSISAQIASSVTSSLNNLRHTEDSSTSYLDCLVLHSPLPTLKETLSAWQAMESNVPHRVRTLGISNIYSPTALRALYDSATIKPSVVQNRFFAESGYDAEIRRFCSEKGMMYQSFWTLTANPHLLASRAVRSLLEKVHLEGKGGRVSAEVALYGLVLGLGNTCVLDGTTNVKRMEEDLAGEEKIRRWRQSSPKDSKEIQDAFQQLIV